MAAMRARRPARKSGDGEGRTLRARRAAPTRGMPKLAAIKLSGGITADDIGVSPKSLGVALASFVLIAGASIAGAAWLGSSLFDAREAFARGADAAASNAGFGISTINVSGVTGARAEEVRAQVVPEGRHSIISLDPADVRDRIESLDWVEHARVRRLWPSTLKIDVERRRAFARWQDNGAVSVIDVNGERLLAERASDHPELPLVIGAGAGASAEPLLIALEQLPELRTRLHALQRVNNRRWNLELNSGLRVALPEDDPARAMAQLEGLQREHRLLDRPIAVVDMRTPGRVAVRVQPELGGINSIGGA